MNRYTLEAGRCILRDGKRILTVTRTGEQGPFELTPAECDEYARTIVALLNAEVNLAECQNCRRVLLEDGLAMIRDYTERVSSDEPTPAGECPHCGALAHLVDIP